jgi:hypothetical protein
VGHAGPRRLLAVAERGVEDQDPVRVRDRFDVGHDDSLVRSGRLRNARSPEIRRSASLGASMVGREWSVRTANPKTTPGR